MKKYRGLIMTFIKAMLIVQASVAYIYILQNYYPGATFFYKGNYLLFGLYAALLILFSSVYKCFQIGIYRIRELTLSFALALLFTNAITFFQICLIARTILLPWAFGVALIIQSLLGMLLYMEATKIYFKLYPSRSMIAVTDLSENDMIVIQKFNYIRERFNIDEFISADEPFENIKERIDKYDAVLLCSIDSDKREKLISYCYSRSKRLYIRPTISDIIENKSVPIQVNDSLMFLCRNRGLSMGQRILKRLMDIVLSLLGLTLLSPLMVVIAICIKCCDGGSVFYRQKRYTLGGQVFEMIKFRSMREDAEKDGIRLATIDDDRITPIGRIIRAARIDELPQLWNILKGDMSLVGPRAERVENTDAYSAIMPEFRYRLKVKAGLTGYAQIYGRYNTNYEDKGRMDLFYIENYSVMNDLALIFATFKVLFLKESTQGFTQKSIDNEILSHINNVSSDDSKSKENGNE